jgi:hypothetical protein
MLLIIQFIQPSVTSSLFGPNILLNTLFSNTLSLCSSLNIKSKSKLYYDRRSAGQSVLEQNTHLGLTTRSWLLCDSCGFVDLGRPHWREDGSAVCNCYWLSPAQSFSGPSPVGLVVIFYCLRFETSLLVASYDSQGHGGGIRPRLHTGTLISETNYALYSLGVNPMGNTALPRNGRPLLLSIVARITQKWAVYPESVSAGTCLSSRCLTMDLYITIYSFGLSNALTNLSAY